MILSLLLTAYGGGGGGSLATPTPPSPDTHPSGPPVLGPQCQSGSVARLALPTRPPPGRNQELALLACCRRADRQRPVAQTGGNDPQPAERPLARALSVAPPQAGNYSFSVEPRRRRRHAPHRRGGHHRQCGRRLAHGHPRRAPPSGPAADLAARLDRQLRRRRLRQSHRDGARSKAPPPRARRHRQLGVIFHRPSVTQDSPCACAPPPATPDGRNWTQDFSLLVQPGPAMAAQALFDSSDPASRVYPLPEHQRPRRCFARLHLPPRARQQQHLHHGTATGAWPGDPRRAADGRAGHGPRARLQRLDGPTLRGLPARVRRGGRLPPPAQRHHCHRHRWPRAPRLLLEWHWRHLPRRQLPLDHASGARHRQRDARPRADYGNDLAFAYALALRQNNQSAGGRSPVLERVRAARPTRRRSGQLALSRAHPRQRLLPARLHTVLNGSLRVYQATPANTASEMLRAQLPFKSQAMVDLGRVQFFGETASATQRAYTPTDIAGFSTDVVTDDYNYLAQRSTGAPRRRRHARRGSS